MSNIINNIFYVYTNVKLYHWMTKSYARHKAADEFIEEFLELTDKFVEVYIGKYGRPVIQKNDKNLRIVILDDKSVVKFLQDAILEFMKYNKAEDVDLLNIRDEIISLFHKTEYLMTLQ